MELLSVLRLLVGGLFLAYASISDLRTRRVPNPVWMVLGLIAFIILALDLANQPDAVWVHYLIFVPAGILFYEVYLDREPIIDEEGFHLVPLGIGLYAVVFVVLGVQAYLLCQNADQMNLFHHLLTVPAMIVVAHVFFQTGLLKGGADAKALMAVAVLLPFYPDFYGFPLVRMSPDVTNMISIIFPFSLVVLMNGAILIIFAPLVFLGINAKRGDLEFPQCLFGYKVSLNDFPKFTWLMERVEEDGVSITLFPKRGGDYDEDINALRDMGREEAWATPQLPFMVPMFLGFIVSFLVGNLVLALLLALI